MLRVLFVSRRCCPRVAKEGRALLSAGVDVVFLQEGLPEAFRTLLPNQFYYRKRKDLAEKLKALGPSVHIVHTHEEPAWLGWFAKEQLPDHPVIFDAHDLDYCRSDGKEIPEDEDRSLTECDGIVLPSRHYQDMVVKGFGVSNSAVILSMNVLDDYPDEVMPRVNGLVYEGGVGVTTQEERERGALKYRDHRPFAVALYNQGIPFHVYPGGSIEDAEAYIEAGVIWHHSLQHQPLLKQLTRYDWGYIGANYRNHIWDGAMPNKIFDYVAAGLPVLVYNAKEPGEYVEKHGLGISVEAETCEEGVRKIVGRYHEHVDYRKTVKALQKEHAMETQVETLVSLYTEAARANKERNRKKAA